MILPLVSHADSLPHRVAVTGVLGEILEQLQKCQLDALLSGDVCVAQQLMQGLTDVPRRVLGSKVKTCLVE